MKIKWLSEPRETNYPAAVPYLSLIYELSMGKLSLPTDITDYVPYIRLTKI